MAALGDQVGVHLTQGGQETVGIVADDRVFAVCNRHTVGGNLLARQGCDPDTAALVRGSVGTGGGDDVDRVGQVRDDSDGDTVVTEVGAQHRVGRVVGA